MDRAAQTLDGITRVDVVSLSGHVDGGRIVFHAYVRIWFDLIERVHG